MESRSNSRSQSGRSRSHSRSQSRSRVPVSESKKTTASLPAPSKDELDRISALSLLNAPHTIILAFARAIASFVASVLASALDHMTWVTIAIMLGGVMIGTFQSPPESLQGVHHLLTNTGSFALYWLTLGVLSSVGLGSGLHTFLLFLGPHIIRVANTAAFCGTTDFTAEMSTYLSWRAEYTDSAWDCQTRSDNDPHLLSVLQKVQWPCFLWGLGTALGELPPYFVSRHARLAGEQLAELKEVDDAEHDAHPGLLDRAKIMVHEGIKRFGFFAILLAASIPNPLFDLAGLTCGHFLIPFWTFFGATAIGKSVVKVSIQALFYVAVFNVKTIERVEGFLPDAYKHWVDIAKSKLLASQYKMCGDHKVTAKLTESQISDITTQGQNSTLLNLGGGVGMTRESFEQCKSCCYDFFHKLHGQETVEACEEGCGTLRPPESILAQAWSYVIGLVLLGFFLSIVVDTAHHQLIHEASLRAHMAEQHQTRRNPPRATKRSQSEERPLSPSQSRWASRSRDRSPSPSPARSRTPRR